MIHSLKRTPLTAGFLLALNNLLFSSAELAGPNDPVEIEFQFNTESSDKQ